MSSQPMKGHNDMFQHATITHKDRKVTFAFDGPAISEPDDFEDWHARIKITVTHDSKKKRYEAHVSWCKAAERDGYTMEQFAIFSDPYVLVCAEPTGRFSESKFSAFVARAQSECAALVDDETNISTAAELLRRARDFAAVKN